VSTLADWKRTDLRGLETSGSGTIVASWDVQGFVVTNASENIFE